MNKVHFITFFAKIRHNYLWISRLIDESGRFQSIIVNPLIRRFFHVKSTSCIRKKMFLEFQRNYRKSVQRHQASIKLQIKIFITHFSWNISETERIDMSRADVIPFIFNCHFGLLDASRIDLSDFPDQLQIQILDQFS